MKIAWILFQLTLSLASTSCAPCVWRYARFHLVCQAKLHLSLVWCFVLLTDDILCEPLISSWIGHQTVKVLLSPYSYSEMNTAVHLLHLTSVARVNEFYLFFLPDCSFHSPFFSVFIYDVFVSHTACFSLILVNFVRTHFGEALICLPFFVSIFDSTASLTRCLWLVDTSLVAAWSFPPWFNSVNRMLLHHHLGSAYLYVDPLYLHTQQHCLHL